MKFFKKYKNFIFSLICLSFSHFLYANESLILEEFIVKKVDTKTFYLPIKAIYRFNGQNYLLSDTVNWIEQTFHVVSQKQNKRPEGVFDYCFSINADSDLPNKLKVPIIDGLHSLLGLGNFLTIDHDVLITRLEIQPELEKFLDPNSAAELLEQKNQDTSYSLITSLKNITLHQLIARVWSNEYFINLANSYHNQ